MPMPRLMMMIECSTPSTYVDSEESLTYRSMPIVAVTNPVKVTQRGPNRGRSWLAIPALMTMHSENGRKSNPVVSGE